MRRRWSVLATAAISVFGIQTARAAETSNNSAETAEVTVTGEETGSLTSALPEESAKQKTQIQGAFTVKTTDDMDLGRASNFEDLLQRTPGVFLQSENGSEVSKISIRGSGITSEDEPLGVMFLLDGVNFNQGDGETILENAAREPEVTDLVVLLRKMGAQIEGDGTSTLCIRGVKSLRGAEHTIIPDRIEAGTRSTENSDFVGE